MLSFCAKPLRVQCCWALETRKVLTDPILYARLRSSELKRCVFSARPKIRLIPEK